MHGNALDGKNDENLERGRGQIFIGREEVARSIALGNKCQAVLSVQRTSFCAGQEVPRVFDCFWRLVGRHVGYKLGTLELSPTQMRFMIKYRWSLTSSLT